MRRRGTGQIDMKVKTNRPTDSVMGDGSNQPQLLSCQAAARGLGFGFSGLSWLVSRVGALITICFGCTVVELLALIWPINRGPAG